VQKFYASHKFQRNFKITSPAGGEMKELKPSVSVIRNLMGYAAALRMMNTRFLGKVAVILN